MTRSPGGAVEHDTEDRGRPGANPEERVADFDGAEAAA
jgi:hypothetical protein